MSLGDAMESLRRGEFVLLHDSAGRENEIDMVVAAQHATPEHVARMRMHAGGLICLAMDSSLASSIQIRYMHEMLAETLDSESSAMITGLAPYGDCPTFSISVNHYRTYTGVTDRDRALTIKEMAGLCGAESPKKKFASTFRTPGHVPLLIASAGLLERRRGHTEMSVYMAKMAGLSPVTAICEMMDAKTYSALSVDKAAAYARHNAIPFVDGAELAEYAQVHAT